MKYVYRVDPVPYTGKSNWKIPWKYPKTTQERRWSIPHKKYIRCRRNYKLLPSVWDDVLRSDVKGGYISWKRNKKVKRQYMKHL